LRLSAYFLRKTDFHEETSPLFIDYIVDDSNVTSAAKTAFNVLSAGYYL
jgi:hypothetical protein